VKPQRQFGMTLVIVLVMLVVVSLLVASAIRFSTINLKISGNVQSEVEAAAAAQLAVESTVATMVATTNISTIAADPTRSVSTGGQTYTVNVAKPACVYSKNINTASLDPTKAADRACFEAGDTEKQLLSTGNLSTTPSACRDQQWDVAASVNDARSGAKTTVLQGVAMRVGAEVQCP
jgi:hypothetical protein